MEDKYPKQFIISKRKCDVLPGWTQETICGVVVTRSITIPLVKLIFSDSVKGFVLGWFAYNDQFFFQDGEISVRSIDIDFYLQLSGRFIIFVNNTSALVYSDPGGQLSLIYDKKFNTVASTPAIIQLFRDIYWDAEVSEKVVRKDGKSWYPFGLVPYKDMERILPGRVLDISTGKIDLINYLPVAPTKDYNFESVEEIYNEIKSNILAMSTAGRLSAHLTAGYDSRIILSAVLGSKVRVNYNTIRFDSIGSKLDCEIACFLAKKYLLSHRVLSYVNPEKSDLDAWRERTSHCIDDAVATLCKTVENYDDGSFTITGNCGEVGRAFYWRNGDIGRRSTIDADDLLTRLGFEHSTFLLSACEKWIKEVSSGLNMTAILDLAYIDLRLGCWAGPSVYGHNVVRPTISPFNKGSIYKKILSLPEKLRFGNTFAKELIAMASEDLAMIPCNRAIGLRKLFYLKQELKAKLPENVKMIKRLFQTR